MQKLILVLVLAALGVAGWQAFEASNLKDDLATQRTEQEELRGDVARLSRTLAELEDRETPGAPITWAATSGATPDDDAAGQPSLAPRATSPTVLARALQDLKGEVRELKQENEDLREKVGTTPRIRHRSPTFIRDADSAEKALELTSAQRADLERTVEWTKRELEDLWSIPNEDGKLFSEIEKTKAQGGENFQIVLPNFQEINKFRNSRVPGRTETYGEAEKRIRDRGKKDVRDTLTPEQQKKWDESWTDPLFGDSMNNAISMVAFESSSSSSSSDD